MKKSIIIFISMILIFFSGIKVSAEENDEKREDKQNLLILMLSYPEYAKDIEKTADGSVYLVMSNGVKILYDDKKTKNEDLRFYNTDLQDMLEEMYPLEGINEVYSADPGRLRNYKFLSCVYGNSKSEVEKNLTTISTLYGNIIFNKSNGAAEKLKKSLNEVHNLSAGNSKINTYIYPISGTFNYRRIQDTGMLSPHAYGIAIDLHRDSLDYWKWTDKEHGSKRIASYPAEIVRIFEDNGFVWGGKWEHFDILHFEYKPEIIMKAKCFAKDNLQDGWYKCIKDDETTDDLIQKINDIFD